MSIQHRGMGSPAAVLDTPTDVLPAEIARYLTGVIQRRSTSCPEKSATTFLPLTLPIAGRFSKLFHRQI